MGEWMKKCRKEWSSGELNRWWNRAKRSGGGGDGGLEE